MRVTFGTITYASARSKRIASINVVRLLIVFITVEFMLIFCTTHPRAHSHLNMELVFADKCLPISVFIIRQSLLECGVTKRYSCKLIRIKCLINKIGLSALCIN